MKWRTRITPLAVLAVFTVGLLSACSVQDSTPAGTTPTADTTTQAITTTEAPISTTGTPVFTTHVPSTVRATKRTAAQTARPKTTVRTTPTAKQVSRNVYITNTGKRYHYDNHCNGGVYYASTLREAQSRGLTPCLKCAG